MTWPSMDRSLRFDAALTGGLLALGFGWALLVPEQRPLDWFGALLLVVATLPLLAYRRAALSVLVAHTAAAVGYHLHEYPHEAIVPATMVALFAAARYGNRRRTVLVVLIVAPIVVLGIIGLSEAGDNTLVECIGSIGWVVVACIAGEAARLQHAYLAATVDRAERAERTRDQEARRQVAEERLRIARDLHDLLAHTITVIQVQAGVAAHLAGTRQAEPAVLAAALDTITEACADARTELAATVGVLRGPDTESLAPQPTLAQLPALAELAEAAGATVTFEITGDRRPLPPAVEMIGYRIVQEALTNVAKHAAATMAEVRLDYRADRLVLRIADNGCGGAVSDTEQLAGFGLLGMRERAEAVGGTVTVTRGAAGFTATAELPVPRQPESVRIAS